MDQVELTPKQAAVATQLLQGKSNQAIADAVGIAIVTVKLHIHTMCRSTNSMNRTHLALTLERCGIKQKGRKNPDIKLNYSELTGTKEF